MSQQFQVRFDLIIGWFGGVFKVVENMNFPRHSLRGNNVVSLRHISGSVHFSRVVDLHFYLNALVFRGGTSNPCCVAVVVLVVTSVFGGLKRDFHLGIREMRYLHYLHVVLLVIRGMSSNE